MRNFLGFIILFASFIVAVSSCGNNSSNSDKKEDYLNLTPASAGEKLAKEYNAKLDAFKSKLKNEINSFKRGFSSQNFSSRREARENYKSRIDNVIKSWEKDNIEIDAKYIELEQSYSASDLYVFQQNFNTNLNPDDVEEIKTNALSNSAISGLIKTLELENLSNEDIKRHLIGRTIREPSNGYNQGKIIWTIEESHIKDFVIQSVYENSGEYEYNVDLILQREAGLGSVKVGVKLIYVQGEIEDWTLKMLVTKSFDVVTTNRYNEYIEHKLITPLMAGNYIEFRNTCDIDLIVGGIHRSQFETDWNKFTVIVPANDVVTYYNYIDFYKIHFIEIPF